MSKTEIAEETTDTTQVVTTTVKPSSEERKAAREEKYGKKPTLGDCSCMVHLGGLPFGAGEGEIRQFLAGIGRIADITIPVTTTGKTRGFAIVEFNERESVAEAIEKKDKKEIGSRWISVTKVDADRSKAHWLQAPKKTVVVKGTPEGVTEESAKLWVSKLSEGVQQVTISNHGKEPWVYIDLSTDEQAAALVGTQKWGKASVTVARKQEKRNKSKPGYKGSAKKCKK